MVDIPRALETFSMLAAELFYNLKLRREESWWLLLVYMFYPKTGWTSRVSRLAIVILGDYHLATILQHDHCHEA